MMLWYQYFLEEERDRRGNNSNNTYFKGQDLLWAQIEMFINMCPYNQLWYTMK